MRLSTGPKGNQKKCKRGQVSPPLSSLNGEGPFWTDRGDPHDVAFDRASMSKDPLGMVIRGSQYRKHPGKTFS